jgi:large subunit ribosomal protein L10
MDVRPERRKMSVESIKTKSAIVDEIKAKLEGAESVVVIDYIGTTVEQATAMRKKLREADVDYTVYKNTMIARAVEGTAFEGIKDSLEGPSALAISKSDAVAPARVINGAIKEYGKMAFKAGYVEGILYDAEGLTQIANIPSRDELIAKFMGSIQSPVGKFVRTLAAIAEAKAE